MKNLVAYLSSFFIFYFISFCHVAVAQTSGGPDTYGYTWINSNDAGGPAFNWIDISATGTQAMGLLDDNFVGLVNMGINFDYYGTTYSSIRIGSNGWLSFGTTTNLLQCFDLIPFTGGKGDNFIAPFLTDLNFNGPANPGKVYYETQSDQFILSYLNAPWWTNAIPDYIGDNSFQVILDQSDNSITFQYLNVDLANLPNIGSCTNDLQAGFENQDGSDGLQIHSESNPPSNNLAIKITSPVVISPVTATELQAASCNAMDGQAQITITGGTPPYLVDGTTYPNSPITITGLSVGTHTFMVSDAGSISTNVSVQITNGCSPTIARTNPNDPTSFDPCSCGDPLNYYDGNGDITYFHDFVEVTSVTGEIWTVTAVAGAFADNGVTPIVPTDPLTETPPGSGIYRIDLFHAPGVGFTMTVDRTGAPFPLMEGGTCMACQQIPTLGQWGLILLSLLILTFGVVALRRREMVLAVAGGVSFPTNTSRLPFDRAAFSKMLIVVMLGLAAVFALAVTMFGYEMTSADVPGSLVCGPLLAYLLHVVFEKK